MADTEVALAVGPDTFHFVKRVYHCPAPSKDVTVDWWELRDSSGKVLYREEYKTDLKCDETVDVGARALNGQQGSEPKDRRVRRDPVIAVIGKPPATRKPRVPGTQAHDEVRRNL